MAMITATKLIKTARPPPRGIGLACTFLADGKSKNPTLKASRLINGINETTTKNDSSNELR